VTKPPPSTPSAVPSPRRDSFIDSTMSRASGIMKTTSVSSSESARPSAEMRTGSGAVASITMSRSPRMRHEPPPAVAGVSKGSMRTATPRAAVTRSSSSKRGCSSILQASPSPSAPAPFRDRSQATHPPQKRKPDPPIQVARGSLERPPELLRVIPLLEGEPGALVRRELLELLPVKPTFPGHRSCTVTGQDASAKNGVEVASITTLQLGKFRIPTCQNTAARVRPTPTVKSSRSVLLVPSAAVRRFAQVCLRWRAADPIDIPRGINRDEHQRIV
jgi:hypothetical protein